MTKKDEAEKLKESVRRAKARIEAESYLEANGLDADFFAATGDDFDSQHDE